MAAFPTLGAQQETNRKILEDLQLKKQLLQKGSLPGLSTGLTTASINQVLYMPTTQLLVQPSEFSQGGAVATAPRSVFNPTSSTTLGFFIPQDSYYGNTFIPVLPRLEPLPPNHAAK